MKADEFITEYKKDRKAPKFNIKPRTGHAPTQTGAGAHKDKKKAEKHGETKHKGKPMDEGRHGYDDMGYSLAPGHDEGEPVYNPRYDVVGRGNDRHWQPDRDQYSGSRERKGFIFYNVPAGQEDKAYDMRLKKTRSGKWYLPTGDRFAQKVADMHFGKGRIWYPKD